MSNYNASDPRAVEMTSAISMYSSAKSVPFFRNLLNERQFPLTAAQSNKLTRKAEPTWEHTCPVCGGVLVNDGCKRHGIAAHESRRELGQSRPELRNIVWKTWLADRQRMVIVVQQTMSKTVQVSTDVFESEPRKITFDRFFVVMAEQATLRFRSEREIEVANKVYFGRGVGLGEWMVDPTGRNPRKSWSVYEPVEEFHGPLDTADEANQLAERWAQQINDELRDQRGAFEEVDAMASIG